MDDRYGVVYYNGEEDVKLASGKPYGEMMELAKSVARRHGMKPESDMEDGVVALYTLKENAMLVKAVGVVRS